MSTATSGRAREYRVRDHLIGEGWSAIMRAAASKGAADLLMAHPVRGAALVQVGTPTKSLGPADRLRFTAAAEMCGALCILATADRSGIRYHEVTIGLPATWEGWTP